MQEKIEELSAKHGLSRTSGSASEIADQVAKSISVYVPDTARLLGVSAHPKRGLVNVYYSGTWDPREIAVLTKWVDDVYGLRLECISDTPAGPGPIPPGIHISK
jgi:hypothetical protein